VVRKQFATHPGTQGLVRCFKFTETVKDTWIVMEVAGPSISQILCQMNGEFYQNERVYRITFSKAFQDLFRLRENNLLRSLITRTV